MVPQTSPLLSWAVIWYVQTFVNVFKEANPVNLGDEKTWFYRWGCHSPSRWVMGLGWQGNRSIQVTGQTLQSLSAQENPLRKFKALHPEASSNLFCFRREISCDLVTYISSYYLWLIIVILQSLCEMYAALFVMVNLTESFSVLCKSKRKMLKYLFFDIRNGSFAVCRDLLYRSNSRRLF